MHSVNLRQAHCGGGIHQGRFKCNVFAEKITKLINRYKRIGYNPYILRNFKNATFYVDYFLYRVDLMLFPSQYFILSRDKQQLTVKRILLRPFILTLP